MPVQNSWTVHHRVECEVAVALVLYVHCMIIRLSWWALRSKRYYPLSHYTVVMITEKGVLKYVYAQWVAIPWCKILLIHKELKKQSQTFSLLSIRLGKQGSKAILTKSLKFWDLWNSIMLHIWPTLFWSEVTEVQNLFSFSLCRQKKGT